MKGIDAHYDLSDDHSSRDTSPSIYFSSDHDHHNAKMSKLNAFFAYKRRMKRAARREASKEVAKNDTKEPDFFKDYLGALTMKKICSLDK
jgi:hypothetical protein